MKENTIKELTILAVENLLESCQNLKSVSFGDILWHHQNLWEVPANVDNFFVLFATHNFTNSSLFNVCFLPNNRFVKPKEPYCCLLFHRKMVLPWE